MGEKGRRPVEGDTRLAQIMRKQNVFAYKVAAELGMSDRRLRERTSGRKKLTTEEQVKLAKILDVPEEWLDDDVEKKDAN